MADAVLTIQTALLLASQGRSNEAVESIRALLTAEPDNVDALGLLGILRWQQGGVSEAVTALERAVALRPAAPALHYHLGMALRSVPQGEEAALARFGSAVALQPNFAEAHLEHGNTLKRLGRVREALPSLAEASRLAPQNAAAWLNLGVAQLESRQAAKAVASFRKAVEVEPTRAEAHNVLGSALMEHGEVAEAQAAFQHAIQLKPDYAAAYNNLARTFRARGAMREAVAAYRTALALAPDAEIHSNLVYALNFMPELSTEEVWQEHAAWGQRYGGATARDGVGEVTLAIADRKPDRRLRVGFVSPDFVNHAVAYFFEPLLAARKLEEWEVFCYSDVRMPDAVTQRLKGLSDHWVDCFHLEDAALVQRIQADRIDILVDLAGHTANNRLTVFAKKPAPMQLSWLGYPNTTGLRSIDFRVTDAICDPPGMTDRWHSEKLLRLPNGFLCYRPPEPTPVVSPLPAQSAGYVTFASFNNFAKVSAPTLTCWARILAAVPASRLVLKSRGLADPSVARQIYERFSAQGVDPRRVVLDGKLVSTAEHLAQYHRVDIALDPFPYNGTTTTCEALWMGVPVVTLMGQTHVARVGASLLTTIGHPEWIGATEEAYVENALALASDWAALAEIRGALRAEVVRSRLCAAAEFFHDFSSALRECWRACGESGQ